MAQTTYIEAYAGETNRLHFDFSDTLDAAETISARSAYVIRAYPASGSDGHGSATVVTAVSAPKQIVVDFSGGLVGRRYEITATATTSAGRVLKNVISLSVLDALTAQPQ